jgi:hypothetical protein
MSESTAVLSDEQLMAAEAFEEQFRKENPDATDEQVIEAVMAFEAGESTPVNVPTKKEQAANGKLAEKNESAIGRIVGLLRKKFEDEGNRNLRIGNEALGHAKWQKGNFAGFESGDFDRLMNRIADEVRLYVPIKNIEVGKYVLAFEFTVRARELVGDAIDKMPYHLMQRYLVPNAFAFSKTGLEGEIKPEWADFVKGIIAEQTGPKPLNVAEFQDRVKAHADRLAAEKAAKADPGKAALEAANKALKEKAKAVGGANAAVTTAVSAALANQFLNGVQVLGIVETVAKAHGVDLPNMGFDPMTCTVKDAKLLAQAMFGAGKIAEMKALRDTLDVLVKQAENAMIQSKVG